MTNKQAPDLYVQNEGTIFLLHPLTENGQLWIDENIDPDAQTFGKAIVIEHRYIGDIVDGAQQDGLTVE